MIKKLLKLLLKSVEKHSYSIGDSPTPTSRPMSSLTCEQHSIEIKNLYPKWNCGVCGDWFHMPYKYCKCGTSQQDINWDLVSELIEIRPKFEADPTLEEDEWHVIFNDYRDLSSGVITKMPFQGGSNMTSTFIVKRVRDDLKRYRK